MKKHLRKIIVEKQGYIWSFNEMSHDWIIVTLLGTSYSRLYINPFIHDFEITPKSISLAITSAIELGWHPQHNSGDMKIELMNGKFVYVT